MTGIQQTGNLYPFCYSIQKIGGSLYGCAANGLYKSDNNGTTWQKKNINGQLFYSPKAVFEVGNGRLLALGGTKYAVVKSDDSGVTWDTAKAFPNFSSGVDLARNSDGTLYAAVWNNTTSSANGIYVSTDNGDSWTLKYAFTQPDLFCGLRIVFLFLEQILVYTALLTQDKHGMA